MKCILRRALWLNWEEKFLTQNNIWWIIFFHFPFSFLRMKNETYLLTFFIYSPLPFESEGLEFKKTFFWYYLKTFFFMKSLFFVQKSSFHVHEVPSFLLFNPPMKTGKYVLNAKDIFSKDSRVRGRETTQVFL